VAGAAAAAVVAWRVLQVGGRRLRAAKGSGGPAGASVQLPHALLALLPLHTVCVAVVPAALVLPLPHAAAQHALDAAAAASGSGAGVACCAAVPVAVVAVVPVLGPGVLPGGGRRHVILVRILAVALLARGGSSARRRRVHGSLLRRRRGAVERQWRCGGQVLQKGEEGVGVGGERWRGRLAARQCHICGEWREQIVRMQQTACCPMA
jgi:hypothetical protein